jgi:outer membrane protein insertion porin family
MFLAKCSDRKLSRVVALVLTVLLLTPALAIAQERQITEIKIVGNEHISTDAIMAVVALKPGTAYSEQVVEKARQAIKSMGYFVSVIAGQENIGPNTTVVFSVEENPIVKGINITGNTVVSQEKLRSLMRTSIGSVLNEGTFEQDLTSIERYYSSQGYIATVNESVGIDPKTGILNIPVQEERVEDIRVTGNKKTKTNVILREMNLKKGDVFNFNTLSADLRRIYDLEIFDREIAEPYKLENGTQVGKTVIITLPVKEKKTGEVSVGAGYSAAQRLVGKATLTENNLRGMAETLRLSWEQSESNGPSYEASFFEPWIDKKHTSLNLDLYDRLIYRFTSDIFGGSGTGINDYDERRKGGSLTLGRPLDKVDRGFLTFRSESVRTGINSSASPIASNGDVTSGQFRVTRDLRDSTTDPLTGRYISLLTEVGTAGFTQETGLPTSSIFTKYSGEYRQYFSKGGTPKLNERRPVLAVRAMAGSVDGNVPFFEQYFVGGADTLRGYKEDRFWGKNMFTASVEPRFPIAPSLTGVLFCDVGDAWGGNDVFINPNNPYTSKDTSLTTLLHDLPQHENFEPRVGYGLGVRVVTPFGPIRLDYGFGSEGSRAHFSIGHAF